MVIDPQIRRGIDKVQLKIAQGNQVRTIEGEKDKQGHWALLATPLDRKIHDLQIPVVVIHSGGALKGVIGNDEITIGDTPIQLRNVRQLDFGKPTKILLADSKTIQGKLEGLSELVIATPNGISIIDRENLISLEVDRDWKGPSRVEYELRVQRGTKVDSINGVFHLGAELAIQPATDANSEPNESTDAEIIQFLSPVKEMFSGGSGRYLVILCHGEQRLFVFDVKINRIIGIIRFKSDVESVRFSASRDHLFLLSDPDRIERRNIHTLAVEHRLDVNTLGLTPGDRPISNIVIGAASYGPLLIKRDGGVARLFDPLTFEKLSFDLGSLSKCKYIFSSAIGESFTGMRRGVSPSGVFVAQREGDNYKSYYGHDSAGMVYANFDGSVLLTSSGRKYSAKAKLLSSSSVSDMKPVPSLIPGYYVSINHSFSSNPPKAHVIDTHTHKKLFVLPAMPERKYRKLARFQPAPHHAQVHVSTHYHRVINLNREGNRLYIRDFDFEEALKSSAKPYFFVKPLETRMAIAGQRFSVNLSGVSSQPPVRFELLNPRDGITLSPKGALTWHVPKDFAPRDIVVAIRLKDQGGKQQLFRIRIHVYRPDEVKLKRLANTAPPGSIKVPPVEKRKTIKLPGKIAATTLAANGELLVLHLPDPGMLVFFSFKERRIVKQVGTDSETALLAGGETNLIMVYPKRHLMERWNLKTFQRDIRTTVPVVGVVGRIAMGYGSQGPLFVGTEYGIHALSPESVREHEWPWTLKPRVRFDARDAPLVISSDGKRAVAGDYHLYVHNNWIDVVKPGKSGALQFFPPMELSISDIRGRSYLSAPWGKPIPETTPSHRYRAYIIPASHPGFNLRVRYEGSQYGANTPTISVHGASNQELIHKLPPQDVMSLQMSERTLGLLQQERYHYHPDLNLLVLIPSRNESLELLHFDLNEALKKRDDYLFVASVPRTEVKEGERFRYQIEAKGRLAPLQYTLVSKPEGMTVSKTGQLQWDVPKNLDKKATGVIVEVRDNQGRSVFHSFTLAVLDPAKPQRSIPTKKELVLWTAKSMEGRQVVITLYDGAKKVSQQLDYLFSRKGPNYKPKRIELPRMYFDRVRIEVRSSTRGSTGLTEIQIIDPKGTNIAKGAATTGTPEANLKTLTDGDVNSSDSRKRWVVPKGKSDCWIELKLGDVK